MWLDIYPKFDSFNKNGVFSNRDNVIEIFEKFPKDCYVELSYNDSLEISIKNVIGILKDIRIKEDDSGYEGDFYLLSQNSFGLTDEYMNLFVLGTTKQGTVFENIATYQSLTKICLVYKNEILSKHQKRKDIIKQLLKK